MFYHKSADFGREIWMCHFSQHIWKLRWIELYLNSGQMKAFPAYDPSTWSQTLFALQIGPISSRRSNAQHPKVRLRNLIFDKLQKKFDFTIKAYFILFDYQNVIFHVFSEYWWSKHHQVSITNNFQIQTRLFYSTATLPVVPRVVDTKNGCNPFFISSSMAFFQTLSIKN